MAGRSVPPSGHPRGGGDLAFEFVGAVEPPKPKPLPEQKPRVQAGLEDLSHLRFSDDGAVKEAARKKGWLPFVNKKNGERGFRIPEVPDSVVYASWERGLEMLPSADEWLRERRKPVPEALEQRLHDQECELDEDRLRGEQDAERKRKEAEDAKRSAEEAEEEERRLEEEAKRLRQEEQDEKRRLEEEADRLRKEEADAKRRQDEEEERLKKEEEDEKRRQDEEAERLKKEEEDERHRLEEEADKLSKEAEDERRRLDEEAERLQKEAEDEKRRLDEEAERLRKAAEDEERRHEEEAERLRKAAEDEKRRLEEEAERRRIAEEENAAKSVEENEMEEMRRLQREMRQRQELQRADAEAAAAKAVERKRQQDAKRFLKKEHGKQAFAYLAHEGGVDRDVWDHTDDESKRLGCLDAHHVASGGTNDGHVSAQKHVRALEEAVQGNISRSPSPMPARGASPKLAPAAKALRGTSPRPPLFEGRAARAKVDASASRPECRSAFGDRTLRVPHAGPRLGQVPPRPSSASADGRSSTLSQAGQKLMQDAAPAAGRVVARPKTGENKQVRSSTRE